MNKVNHKIITVIALGLMLPGLAQPEVIHQQLNEANLLVRVNNEDWQPEPFKTGTVVPAAYIGAAVITTDGRDNEPQWDMAPEISVPLSYGSVGEASLKALYSDEEVFILVRWKDDSENREHHPWTWDTGQEQYNAGEQVEDSVLLSFEAGCEWFPSLLGGYVYDFDAWHWLASRSDPLGQAVDLSGTVQDRDLTSIGFIKYDGRNQEPVWNLKFTEQQDNMLHAGWDELDRAYLLQPVSETVYVRARPDGEYQAPDFAEQLPPPDNAPEDSTTVYPQYSPLKLEGQAGEVAAKGQWENGYWTVEFRRVLVTPMKTINDAVFNRLTQFSVYVFDGVEQLDQGSESERLFLQFIGMQQQLNEDLRVTGD